MVSWPYQWWRQRLPLSCPGRGLLPRLYHTVLYGSAYMVGFLCALLYLFLVLICYPGAACQPAAHLALTYHTACSILQP